MQLAHPWVLLALGLLPVYLVLRQRARRQAVEIFAPRQLVATARRRSRATVAGASLEVASLAIVVLALAQPHLEDRYETVREDGIDVALVLDISASMQAADITPNRLEALKDLAQGLVEEAGGNRIGVFVFAKHVFTQTPLTTDTRVLNDLIESLRFETIQHGESGGTALGDALLVANDALERQRVEGRDQLIVAFTDGESHEGIDPLLAARAVRESGTALQIIGLGRTEPVTVYVYGEPFINANDEILRTQLQEEQLEEVAATGGGIYRHAENLAVLQEIFAELELLTRAPLEVKRQVVRRSLVPQLALVLLGLFALWLWIEGTLVRSPLR